MYVYLTFNLGQFSLLAYFWPMCLEGSTHLKISPIETRVKIPFLFAWFDAYPAMFMIFDDNHLI